MRATSRPSGNLITIHRRRLPRHERPEYEAPRKRPDLPDAKQWEARFEETWRRLTGRER